MTTRIKNKSVGIGCACSQNQIGFRFYTCKKKKEKNKKQMVDERNRTWMNYTTKQRKQSNVSSMGIQKSPWQKKYLKNSFGHLLEHKGFPLLIHLQRRRRALVLHEWDQALLQGQVWEGGSKHSEVRRKNPKYVEIRIMETDKTEQAGQRNR